MQGGYSDGAEEGQGVIRYSNGNVLEGQVRKNTRLSINFTQNFNIFNLFKFVEGRIHGRAVFRYPNGNRREGTFVRRFFKRSLLLNYIFHGRLIVALHFLQRSSGRGPVPPRLLREDGEGGVEGREEGLDRRGGGGGGIIFWLRFGFGLVLALIQAHVRKYI